MKKEVVILVGGVAIGSLAAGVGAGYFYATKKIGAAFDERLSLELESTKKFYDNKYEGQLAVDMITIEDQQKTIEKLKNALVDYENSGGADISAEDLDSEEEEPEFSPKDAAALAESKERAKKALVDYGGMSTAKVLRDEKPSLESLVKSNVFDEHGDDKINKRELFADAPRKDHPPLPPRDPQNGRFRPRRSDEDDDDNEPEPDNGDYSDEPYIITEQQFARGKENYDQESGIYYVVDDTIVDVTGEVIEEEILGANNLELFPEEGENGEPPVLYIRNDNKKMDYQITLSTESLTAVTGFTDDMDPHSQYL